MEEEKEEEEEEVEPVANGMSMNEIIAAAFCGRGNARRACSPGAVHMRGSPCLHPEKVALQTREEKSLRKTLLVF